MDIDTCVENFSGAILGALEVSTPKLRPIGDPHPQIPAGVQDEIRLKNRFGDVGKSQGTCLESRGHPPSEVGDQTAQ